MTALLFYLYSFTFLRTHGFILQWMLNNLNAIDFWNFKKQVKGCEKNERIQAVWDYKSGNKKVEWGMKQILLEVEAADAYGNDYCL